MSPVDMPSLIDRALSHDHPDPEDTRAQIMLAGLRQGEEVGLRRATMEDVARRAGLSRVTLYRHFQSKDALVRAIVLCEAQRFFDVLDTATAACPRTEERLVEGFSLALEFTRRHTLFQRLLQSEPESLLPYLVGDSYLMSAARTQVAERINDGSLPQAEALEIAELVVRLVLSLALNPESVLEVADLDRARRFAYRYLVPALAHTDSAR
jgi:AcrR family transcriptional regulator